MDFTHPLIGDGTVIFFFLVILSLSDSSLFQHLSDVFQFAWGPVFHLQYDNFELGTVEVRLVFSSSSWQGLTVEVGVVF